MGYGHVFGLEFCTYNLDAQSTSLCSTIDASKGFVEYSLSVLHDSNISSFYGFQEDIHRKSFIVRVSVRELSSNSVSRKTPQSGAFGNGENS